MVLQFVPLHERPADIQTVAGWLEQEWPAWYGEHGNGNALADAQAYAASSSNLPCGILGLENGRAVAFGALKTESFPTHPELGPWVGAGFVLPGKRGAGIGQQLLSALVDHASSLGHHKLYCATSTAAALLRRSGWRELAQVQHDGLAVHVFEHAV